MEKSKNQFIKDAMPVLLVFVLFMAFTIWRNGGISFSDEENYHQTTGEIILNNGKLFDVNDESDINRFLNSKKFRNDGMTLKFSPGYFELDKDNNVALTGGWRIGNRVFDTSVMLYLETSRGDLSFMLSSDGKIMDKSTLRVFK